MAGRSSHGEQPVTLAPGVARELENIVGLKLSTATPKSVREQVGALSNPDPPPMGLTKRYSQVCHLY